MAGLKTRATAASVTEFMNSIEDEDQRADCRAIAAMMRKATGKRAKMWGASMVGYGSYHYQYASGQQGDYFLTGFSPRKQATTVYIMPGFSGYESLMKRLGKYKTGRSCLYIRKLGDVDSDVLQQLITRSVDDMRKKYPTT